VALGQDIIDFVLGLIAAVNVRISAAISFASSLVVTAVNSVMATVKALVAGASAVATALFNSATALTKSLVAGVTALVHSLIGSLTVQTVNMNGITETKLIGMLGAVQSALIALFSPALAGWNLYKDFLADLKTFLTADNKTKLLDFINRLYGFLVSLVTNPLGWLFGVMYASFQSFICYVLAYGLGTVEAELPPIPEWGNAGGGIYPPGGAPPGAGASGLFMPCSPVYISGYIFTPDHKAVDLGIVNNQSIFAMHDGIVEGSGWSSVGYGFKVDVRGGRYWSRYAHLATPLVANGQQVTAGQLIAYGNSTGNSTGSHLHLEIKLDGLYIDPMTVLY